MSLVHLVGETTGIHGEESQQPQRSTLSIGALATNYLEARKNSIQRKPESWICPIKVEVKINVAPTYSVDP
jgi:hypothetical protein